MEENQVYDHFKQAGVHLDQFFSDFSYRLTDPYGDIQRNRRLYKGEGKERNILYLMEYSSLLLDVLPTES